MTPRKEQHRDHAIPGLKPFTVVGQQECSLQRFQWVLQGSLGRCSQPGYRSHDEAHTLRPYEATLLRMKKIVCVVSANIFCMDQAGLDLLAMAGIDFVHDRVPDFAAPRLAQLNRVPDVIEDRRSRAQNPGATLVYCGYGQGRTGTYVVGWAMLKYMARSRVKDMCTLASLSRQFGVERPVQAQAFCQVVGQPYVEGAGGGTGLALSGTSFAGPPGAASGPFIPSGPRYPSPPRTNSGPSGCSMPGSGSFNFYKSKF